MEMNMHAPQSEQSRIELRELASVPSQIISPATHKPIISIVQDSLVGSYLFTRYDNYLTRKDVLDIMVDVSTFDGTLPDPEIKANTPDEKLPEGFPKWKYPRTQDLWSGRQVFSMIIPNVNLKQGSVSILNGIVQSGVFDSKILGQSEQSLIHIIFNELGQEKTQQFLDNIQNIVTNWMLKSGFSVGIGDLITDEYTTQKIKDTIESSKRDVINLIEHVHKGILESKFGKSTAEEFEIQVSTALQKATGNTGSFAVKNLDGANRMLAMVNSGSKGKEFNVSQMVACVGQQTVDNRRIPYGFTERTLPHFHKYDDGASARGFVESSFIRGLNPTEFFFHAMGGREGLIDTAVKSVTGDTKIVVLENQRIRYVAIGDWIDAKLDTQADRVRHFEERQMELLDLDPATDKVFIPTMDYQGNVSWAEMSAITRHDPGTELYQIKTQSGREVIVTESKSLLIWKEDLQEFREVETPTIQVGDCVPLTRKLTYGPIIYEMTEYEIVEHGERMHTLTEFPWEYVLLDEQTIRILLGFYLAKIEPSDTIHHSNPEFLDGLAMLFSRIGWLTTRDPDGSLRVHEPRRGKEWCLKRHNNICLDPIVEINVVSVEQYPKVYDLTIPSTLNFGLANGLQVRDTSETGYIQRRLVKAMEDAHIVTDYSVRNANGTIIQFVYGEDGFDGAKIEKQTLWTVGKSDADIYKRYMLPLDSSVSSLYQPDIADDLLQKSAIVREAFEAHLQKLLGDRDYYFQRVYNGNIMEPTVFAPVNIDRLVNNASQNFASHGLASDLHPMYVLQKIQDLKKDLCINPMYPANDVIITLAHIYLAPMVLLEKKITRTAFDWIHSNILHTFYASIASPGELVGTIAAQSIGEPSTQMSNVGSTKILIHSGHKPAYFGEIKTFCDNLIDIALKKQDESLQQHGDSTILDLEDDYYIVGVSQDEKTSWRRIQQISRHPANGRMVEVHTRTHRKTTATLTHSFLTRSSEGVVPILGSELKVGMRIPVARYIPEVPNPIHQTTVNGQVLHLNTELGWICGMYLADGYTSGNFVKISKIHPIVEERCRQISSKYNGWKVSTRHYQSEYGPSKDNIIHSKSLKDFILAQFGEGCYEKTVSEFIYNTNSEFIRGIVGGFFDGDGNIDSNKQMIRCGSRNQDLIKHISRMMSFGGIFGTLCEEVSVNYEGQVFYTIQIPKNLATQFRDSIPMYTDHKVQALYEIIEYLNRADKITDKEYLDKIPVIVNSVAILGKLLQMPNQSRTYGRWAKKESIGRTTLRKYYTAFEEKIETDGGLKEYHCSDEIQKHMEAIRSALEADVIWDEIVELKYLEDPKEYVYDFTVPGNDSFMVDDNVLVHNTLNTFHAAGTVSSVNQGVPRFKELLSVTRNIKTPSICTVLKQPYCYNKEYSQKVMHELAITTIRQLTQTTEIYFDVDSMHSLASDIPEDNELLSIYKEFDALDRVQDNSYLSPWVLRLKLDKMKMMDKNIRMSDVYFAIMQKFSGGNVGSRAEKRQDIHCVFSDDNSANLIVRIQTRVVFKDDQRDCDEGDMICIMKEMEKTILNDIILKGVQNVKGAYLVPDDNNHIYDETTKEFVKKKQWIIYTDGTNLEDIMIHPSIDPTKTWSNDIYEVYETLGLEAARQVLFNEIVGVFKNAGSYINYRHINLLVDLMTNRGSFMSVDRHGINKSDRGPLAKCSFEETPDIIARAAIFGELDPVKSVSASIMLGDEVKIGSGSVDVNLDEERYFQWMSEIPEVKEEEEEVVDIAERSAFASKFCESLF